MRKGRRLAWCWVFILSIVVAAVFIAAFVILDGAFLKKLSSPVDFAVGISSIALALFALFFALFTFFSIASVEAMSRMDGNVLSNEHYGIQNAELIDRFIDIERQADFDKKLFDELLSLFEGRIFSSKRLTNIQLTNNLQKVIDHLLWFAYVDYGSIDVQHKMVKLVKQLKKQMRQVRSLSGGSEHLIEENIEMILLILKYQFFKKLDPLSVNEIFSVTRKHLINVRGGMLVNPVTKTTYYNYLGLEHFHKAQARIQQLRGIDKETHFSLPYLERIHFQLENEDSAYVLYHIKQSIEHFEKSLKSGKKDILWCGYIQYNLGRALILLRSIDQTAVDNKRIIKTLDEALASSKSVLLQFSLETKTDTFLSAKLHQEYHDREATYRSFLEFQNKKNGLLFAPLSS